MEEHNYYLDNEETIDHEHKEFNMVMSKGEMNLLQDYQNPMEEIPLKNLSSINQNRKDQSSRLNLNPEPERLTKKSSNRKSRSKSQKDNIKSSKYETNTIHKKNQSNTVVTFDASSGEDQSDEGVETDTEFELQCSVSSPPPDPKDTIYTKLALMA